MEKKSDKDSGKIRKDREVNGLVFKRQFTRGYKGSKGEVNKELSKTVPNMSKSIRQLVKDHTRGIVTDINQMEGEYFEAEIPRFDDITDMVEHRNMLEDQKEDLEKEHREALKKKKDLKVAQDLKAEKDAETASKTLTQRPSGSEVAQGVPASVDKEKKQTPEE